MSPVTPTSGFKIGDLVEHIHTGKIGMIVEQQEYDYVESWWVRWSNGKRDIMEPQFLKMRFRIGK